MNRYEEARTAFAQFINASPDEVAIVTSVSAGINGVASALNFRERKKVVMGEFEFPTMGHIWLAQRPRGAEVQFVRAEGNRIPAANYEKMVDGNTLIVPHHARLFQERISFRGKRHHANRAPLRRSRDAR